MRVLQNDEINTIKRFKMQGESEYKNYTSNVENTIQLDDYILTYCVETTNIGLKQKTLGVSKIDKTKVFANIFLKEYPQIAEMFNLKKNYSIFYRMFQNRGYTALIIPRK